MSRPLRYIHVGVGGWGAEWVRTILPTAFDYALPVAAVDLDPSRFDLVNRYLGLDRSRFFTSVDEALDAVDADFVTVVVPPAFHEDVVRSAVRAGKHILSEKPIADTMEASVRIADLVAQAGLKMAVTMSHRFDQDKQTLQELRESGVYGDLNYITYRFTSNSRRFGDWGEFRHRMAHPLLIEGTVHHFDILRALSGSNARTVYASTWNPHWAEYEGDSTALLIVEMENGVRCVYEGAKANASTLNGWTQDYIRLEFDRSTVELDRRQVRAITSGPDGLLNTQQLPLSNRRSDWLNPAILRDFCSWLEGGEAVETTVSDNLQCSALLFAAIRSAETGMPVDVQAFLADALSADRRPADRADA